MAPKRQRYRRRPKKQRDTLLFFTTLITLLAVLGGIGYLLVNQRTIMMDVFRNRPNTSIALNQSDTPGLYDLLDRMAAGEAPSVALSPATRDPGRLDRLQQILPETETDSSLTTAQRLELTLDPTWFERYAALVRDQQWKDLGDSLWLDATDVYDSSTQWFRERLDKTVAYFRDNDATEIIRQIGEAGETAVTSLSQPEEPEESIPTVTAIDPETYGGDRLEATSSADQLLSPIARNRIDLTESIETALELSASSRISGWTDPYIGLLANAPEPNLIELTEQGVLPRIGSNGQEPWRVYSRPHNPLDNRPKVAVIITNLGLGLDQTAAALDLPGEVTLAFAPYAQNLSVWIKKARERGHEFLLTLPMEPADYPRSDPGPFGLLIANNETENLRRLHYVLSRVSGYVGVMKFLGGRFTLDPTAVKPIIEDLNRRGLLYVDTQSRQISMASTAATVIGMPNLNVDLTLSDDTTIQSFEAFKRNAVRIAKSRGRLIVSIQPYDNLIRLIRDWIAVLEEDDLTLSPLTAVAIQSSGGQF